jgi:hypothetical protein
MNKMAKMAKGKDVQTGNVGREGFGAPDVSDNLDDMTNYEQAILKPEIFEMLAELKVMTKDTDKAEYQYLVLTAEDIDDLKASSMGAAGHATNSEFAALQIPYRAIPFASKDAEKVTKVAKRGKDAGKEKSVKETDSIKIFRAGKDFDQSLYAVSGWGRTNDAGDELVYESYTVGQEKRADKWLREVAVEEIDEKVLKTIGIEVE